MKQITCEMCGSNDLVKQDGVFVCQHCGSKYSAEEAKKMMVEIDNTKKLANLYERARKSLAVNDLEHAAEYYKQILDENPNDWEAYFYSYLGEVTSYTNAQASSVALKLGDTIPPAYDMAIVDSSADEAKDRIFTITALTCERLLNIASAGAALLREYEGGNIITPAGRVKSDMYRRIRPMAGEIIASCKVVYDQIEAKIRRLMDEHSEIDAETFKQCLLMVCRTRYQIVDWKFEILLGAGERLFLEEIILECAEKLKELDPSFTVPTIEEIEKVELKKDSGEKKDSGGCYVATAVYGSYDCPQVWTLRRFRDYTLAETWYGRAFIRTYYAISPALVKWFGHTEWFKKMWKGKLDRMVKNLNSEGVENTPYEDRKW